MIVKRCRLFMFLCCVSESLHVIDVKKTVTICNQAEFLVEIQTKVLRVFLLVIYSHLYRFALSFLFLQTHTTSYSFCKGERRKN